MASSRLPDDLFEDDDDLDLDLDYPPRNPHASAGRWRHQESSAFARHAISQGAGNRRSVQAPPRDAEARSGISDLADFLNSSRISPEEAKAARGSGPSTPRYKPLMVTPPSLSPTEAKAVRALSPRPDTSAAETGTEREVVAEREKEIAVGPLLNYRRMEGGRWIGSVLVVTKGTRGNKTGEFVPTLTLRRVGQVDGSEVAAQADGANGTAQRNGEESVASAGDATGAEAEANSQVNSQPNGDGAVGSVGNETGTNPRQITGICLYRDPRATFWRFDLACEIEAAETKWEYSLPDLHFSSKTKPQRNSFFVPAATESMRIMFHSCNGFSVGTDEEAWSGPALWNDVLRNHREAPFHVMIGGGDQIYNDGIRVNGPLRAWTDIGNPKKRRDYPFPEALRQACDDYYLRNYIKWFGTEPFASANGQIPQLNIWDDHDIIDGFGSYVDDFMKCDVFRGIGGTAHKYYMLFQHHLPPPASTYTTDATFSHSPDDGQGTDPIQAEHTFVHEKMIEPSYMIGSKPGPYVAEHSHSMYTKLGARVAFLGVDARTERTRHQVNYPETYDQVFERLRRELSASAESSSPIRHLILLLGIPIAYPRLTWLENVFSSPMIGPIKFMNRRFGFGGGFFNHFDGSVDLLDDLDDHYTAKAHKRERSLLIQRLQAISAEFSVRITILGGDVHLAALGRFYNPSPDIPTEHDHRYMANVISSAIVNKPPPQAIANLLARRNKIHHLDANTDETLLKFFNRDPGSSHKTAHFNHVTMPSRNYAMITENSPVRPRTRGAAGDLLAPPSATANGDGHPVPPGSSAGASTHSKFSSRSRSRSGARDGHTPIHAGEVDAGTKHRAATADRRGGGPADGSLDVCIRVEIDQHDHDGHTEGYGVSIPALEYKAPPPVPPLPAAFRKGAAKVEAKTGGL